MVVRHLLGDVNSEFIDQPIHLRVAGLTLSGVSKLVEDAKRVQAEPLVEFLARIEIGGPGMIIALQLRDPRVDRGEGGQKLARGALHPTDAGVGEIIMITAPVTLKSALVL